MKKQFIYGLLSLTVLSGAGLSSCSSEEDFAGPKGQKVMLSITASKDAQTRTSFEETEDGLLCKWTEGDKLLVTNTSGQRLGVITLQGEGGVTTGLFRGPVTLDGNQTVNLFYLGNGKAIPETLTENAYTLDLSAQDGTFASLAANDFMHQEADVKLLDGEATGSVMMDRRVAEGHFDLQLPGGLQLKAGDVVTITQPEGTFHVAPKIKYGNGGSLVNTTDNGTLTITKAEDGNDLYVTIFPQTLTPTFTIKKDGSIYTATLDSHEWVQSTYVCNTTDGSGIAVSDWTKKDLPIDLGDLDNWGGPNVPINMDDTGSWAKIADSNQGYVNNDYSLYISAGFSQPITFYANGITNGYLYSTKVAKPSYYQWGRWLGFPAEIEESPELNAYGQANTDGTIWADELMVPGNLANTTDWTYCNTQYGQIPAGQFYRIYTTTWRGSSGWDKTMSIRAAHIYAMKSLPSSSFCDPLNTNENCTFEDRCGNPCPDGWRIPTVEEIKNLMPSQAVSGSHAEVKNINGENYAMKWVVTTNDEGVKCVRITSVKTSKTSVSVNDAVFNSDDASMLEIGAYGILSNTGELNYKNQRAYVWTNASATASSLSGNAGAALRIVFNGTTATFGIAAQDRINGCNIIPVRDKNAKASSIKPYFPSKWQLYI